MKKAVPIHLQNHQAAPVFQKIPGCFTSRFSIKDLNFIKGETFLEVK